MKRHSSHNTLTALLILLLSNAATSLFAQPLYSIRNDPDNNKRKIIDIKPAVRSAPFVVQTRNVLDNPGYRRPEIPHRPFEMVNPKTRKPLSPEAMLTIKINDSVTKKTTVKQFFAELNEMERALNLRGRTLRVSHTFADLKPDFNNAPYLKKGMLTKGFISTSFNTNSNPPSYFTVTGQLVPNKKFIAISNMSVPKAIEWKTNLYIAERFENHGTVEFPAEWSNVSLSSANRKIFPVILEITKGFAGLIKKIDWQVSDVPFDGTIKDVNLPQVKKTITSSSPVFSTAVRGTDILPDAKASSYASAFIDLSQIEPIPAQPKPYYIRAVCYDAAGDVSKVTGQVIATYGYTPKPFKIAPQEDNSVPGFSYAYPSDPSSPFGLYVKGEGFSTKKRTRYQDDNYDVLITTGIKFKGAADLGLKYFNFASIADGNAPKTKNLSIIKGDFTAIAGSGTGTGNTTEAQGVSLKMNILEGFYTPSIDFTTKIPGTDNISLEYTVKEPINWELINTRFFIGPVPFSIKAKIGGEAGLELGGFVNMSPGYYAFNGRIKPYLHTYFTASGGVDAVIAFATLNADVNPVLNIDMPVLFSSNGKSLDFTNEISALNGRVYLKVGFFYPCPDLGKIVGWISGDEDMPLCECSWEWKIFDFKGYNEVFRY